MTPVEGLLRPVEERISVYTFFLGACWVAFDPASFLLTHQSALLVSGVLMGVAWWREQQARQLIRYQKGLKSLPFWAMASKDIPVYQDKLFLGRGFEIRPRHAQRLYDTRQIWAERFVVPSRLYQWARQMEARYEGTHFGRYLAQQPVFQPSTVWANLNPMLKRCHPAPPLPPVGGDPCLHGVGLAEETDCLLPASARAGHTLVLGTTGVGKTRLAELLVTQDIRRGDVVLNFDPKGDGDMLLRMYIECLRSGRLDDFYILHLGYPNQSGRYSPLGRFSRITEVATRVSGQLEGGGNSAAFKQFAWRFVNIIARAQEALGRRPDMASIQRYVTAIDDLYVDYCLKMLPTYHPKAVDYVAAIEADVTEQNTPRHLQGRSPRVVALERYFQDYPVDDDVLGGLRSAIQYDKTYFDKIVASLLPLLEKLGTGKTAHLISPKHRAHDERPVVDWREIINQNGVVYIGLDALSDTTVAAAFGNSMFADLCSLAGEIYKFGNTPGMDNAKVSPRKIMIHADEFNELIGDEFIPILNKSRGAKFVVTAYTQTESDIEARLGNAAKAGQTKGNFNTLITLRVRELRTAQILTSRMKSATIRDVVPDSGVSDAPGTRTGFKSTNKDAIQTKEVLLISDSDLTNLPIGQAYAELEGAKYWKLRFPLPSNVGDEALPSSIQELVDNMKSRNQTLAPIEWSKTLNDLDKDWSEAFYLGEKESIVTGDVSLDAYHDWMNADA
ncbi:type IV conjugative transfer system coupling protein TraD [Vibrio pectenicida]|uniref:Type IV conjugative transfer system coupling protein TraD n=1 Tax=Vibrio pectenicida TaxID=62763 RepID=A0A427U4X4_9VIBR|nr:type IV conjugative transfer system coupling protein TraD [Vibrio pectenicida]RSD31725.1 type IV conjugative transfer system coupling protein TraD [Vibrio pectenicida]